MVINNEFEIGEIVYLKTDPEQNPRIITGIVVREGGRILYYASFLDQEPAHYGFELTREKDIMLSMNINSGAIEN